MNELAIAEVLERAADLIVVDGWMQGGFGRAGEARCAVGHLQTALNERFGLQQRVAPFCQVYWDTLDVLMRRSGCGLTGWNDRNGRTAGEVRDLFLTAAKNIRNNLSRDGDTQPKGTIP